MKLPGMKRISPAVVASFGLALAMMSATSAGADPDTDFAHELQSYGIYGPRDYNAWLGKIVCERSIAGLDGDAEASVRFIGPNIHKNLQRGPDDVQAWRFLGASINTYCPGQRHIYESAAG